MDYKKYYSLWLGTAIVFSVSAILSFLGYTVDFSYNRGRVVDGSDISTTTIYTLLAALFIYLARKSKNE